MVSTSDQRPRKIGLVLQGGGARGAYHAGVIRAIADITASRRSPFQIVCGSSVGAINAASVAMTSLDFQRGAAKLEDLWRSLHCQSIYDTRALPVLARSSRWAMTLILGQLGLRTMGGLLDYGPLRDLLLRELDTGHIQQSITAGALHALCITASSYSDGTSTTFFQGDDGIPSWSRARRLGERAVIRADHILASAALPFAFAPVQVDNRYFGDGALRTTSPLSPAIHTGADRILIVGTRDGVVGPRNSNQPSLGEIAGHALDILFNDNLDADIERLERINHTISLLDATARTHTNLRVIKAHGVFPSQDIRNLAKLHAGELPRSMRLLLRSIGYAGGDARIESYLMFEPGYIGALIDLGYRDTLARADTIRDFLTEQ